MVSSRSTVHSLDRQESDEEEEEQPPVPALPEVAATPAFIFGSPVQSPASPPSTFSFAMPGSLFSSTTSTTNGEAPEESGKSAVELVMEEMNRRAAEARAANGGMSSLAGSMSTLRGGKKLDSPSKGSKAAFDASHKRAFAQFVPLSRLPESLANILILL
jgi:hypothetical protein